MFVDVSESIFCVGPEIPPGSSVLNFCTQSGSAIVVVVVGQIGASVFILVVQVGATVTKAVETTVIIDSVGVTVSVFVEVRVLP